MKIQRIRMRSPTGKPELVPPVWPNAGVEAWYRTQLETLVDAMHKDLKVTILPAAMRVRPVIAQDSAPETPNAAGILFRCGDRFLILKRADPGFDFWGLPGGKIEAGETSEQAARRETLEEMQLDYRGPLTVYNVHRYRTTRFVTFVADVPKTFVPRLNHEHTLAAWVTREEASRLALHPGVVAALSNQSLAYDPGFAADETLPELQRLLDKWGRQWIKRFDLMSTKLSLDFAARNQRATDTAVASAFKKAGFTVAFKPTRASLAAYKAVAAEQVGLIKSIPEKYLVDVQTKIWQSVKRGADLRTLSASLEKSYGVTKRRAALIARDQNAKAKAVLEAVRHQELGIKQGVWMHSHAGKEPRPTHVAMNGKLYELAQGMWDSDEQMFVHPGELINCRCTMRPYIPGF